MRKSFQNADTVGWQKKKKKGSISFYKHIENKGKTSAQIILYLSGSEVLLTEVQTVLAYKKHEKANCGHY